MKKEKYHMWTKDQVRSLVKMWESKTLDEISEEMGISKGKVSYMAMVIRKRKPSIMPKKHARGLPHNLIDEVLAEL